LNKAISDYSSAASNISKAENAAKNAEAAAEAAQEASDKAVSEVNLLKAAVQRVTDILEVKGWL
jgi:hypothetical protein